MNNECERKDVSTNVCQCAVINVCACVYVSVSVLMLPFKMVLGKDTLKKHSMEKYLKAIQNTNQHTHTDVQTKLPKDGYTYIPLDIYRPREWQTER